MLRPYKQALKVLNAFLLLSLYFSLFTDDKGIKNFLKTYQKGFMNLHVLIKNIKLELTKIKDRMSFSGTKIFKSPHYIRSTYVNVIAKGNDVNDIILLKFLIKKLAGNRYRIDE